MSQQAVRRALESKLKIWAAANALPIAYQNVEFKPPDGNYGRAYLLPAPTTSPDLGRRGRIWLGTFQISLVMATGAGQKAAEALVSSLDGEFDPAVPIAAAGGLLVHLLEPVSAVAPISEGDREVVPVSFPYRAQAYPT